MFQEYALFPHKNVFENVAFGLHLQGTSPEDIEARVREVLELVGLQGFGRRGVGELSGGERQRVALARSLAPRPRLLMLDEPLASLDRSLRERLVEELRRIQRDVLQTILPGMDQFQAKKAVEDYIRSDPEAAEHRVSYFIHGIGLEVHEEPVLVAGRPECVPAESPLYYTPGAVVSSEWFSRCWTVEDPFVMTEEGWVPLGALQGLVTL